MKKLRFLTITIVLMLSLALCFSSCNGSGDETTSAAETTAPAVTDTPTAPADETTSAPEETTEAPHVHVWGEFVIVKAPTCTEEGLSEQSCACGEKQTRTESVLAHTEGEWVEDKAPTCTEAGSKYVQCSVCKTTVKTESIPAKGHTDGDWIIDKEATVTTDGSKHLECLVCKATIKTEVIPATPHTPGEWIVDKSATCTEAGLRHRVCTKCGETTDTETISARGHSEVEDKAKAATCTEDGLTEGKYCSVCKAVLKAQDKIPAKGHTEVTDNAKAATCTEDGLTEGKHCSVCKTVLKAQDKIPATGHKETDWIIDLAATTSSEGSRHTECTVCKVTVKTEVIPKIEIPKVEYSVTVYNANGDGLSGIEVVFAKAGTEVAKVKTDNSGKAAAKLESGDYDFAIEGMDSYYLSSDVSSLTALNVAAKVTLVPYASSPEYVYPAQAEVAPSGGAPGILAGVYSMNTGSLRIPVEKDKMRYVFFRPTEGGIYRFYVDSDKVEVGYYGGSFFVSNSNTGTMLDDGSMELTVLQSSIGNTMVLGYRSTSAAVTECTITIKKHADIGLTLEELEWTPYKPDAKFEKIETPEGYLVSMDLQVFSPLDPAYAEIQVFFNEKDGYYHLESADGPILYVRIGSKSSYLDSLTAIVGTSNLGRYIYDENGEFVMKERYNEIIFAYAEAADDKYNVYPLDEDLCYILKGLADIGWYDRSSPNYIFKMYQGEEVISMIVMPYNGWLFPCVYFK